MEIRYKNTIGIVFAAVGGIFAILILLAGDLSHNITRLILAFFLLYCGFATLSKPYFILNEQSLEIPAILGPTKKIYNFDTYKELFIDRNKIVLNQNGKQETLPIQKWLVENSDWQLLVDRIEE
jgi:hypothetical protein